jgi:glycosyltransferase involved in cell wall biosynthesis
MARTDVLVVSAGNTAGWRTAAEELRNAIGRAGASAEMITSQRSPRVRTFALTDFVEARAARRAALAGIEAHDPRAVIYCSITAALLWPTPGAIFLDSIAAENRPGRHGVWQRPVERRRLRQTPLVLAWSKRSLTPLSGPHANVVVVPVPVEQAPAAHAPVGQPPTPQPPTPQPPTPQPPRDLAAVTYAGDPLKRRLATVLDAWCRARREHEQLVVAGLPPDARERVSGLHDRLSREGVEVADRLDPADFRALLARARVFVAAPRIEDYGIAALEALASGCLVVTTPSRGPYPALDLARELDARLVADEVADNFAADELTADELGDNALARAIRTALDDPRPDYAERAAELLVPFSRKAMDRTVAERVLPRLLAK